MTLSYADVALAKDVLYGMYADTAARGQPQVYISYIIVSTFSRIKTIDKRMYVMIALSQQTADAS
jgi:hypothetical protein